MDQRLIEIILPEGRGDDIQELLHEQSLDGFWRDAVEENKARIRILVSQSEVERVLDILEPYLEKLPGATALLLLVEATIPRNRAADSDNDKNNLQTVEKATTKPARLSRQELFNDIASHIGITGNYIIMVVLSACIAAIGLAKNDTAVLIGAMVLAPLLMPNVGLALASTMGDTDLAGKSLKSALCGVVLSLLIGVAIGYLAPVDSANPALAAKTELAWTDLVLALASGAAGVLAFTSGGQLSLVGVMVAVALMPPLVASGLFLGSGLPLKALQALELAFANVICVNIAGIVTFSLQGIRPATWWENSRAGKARKRALLLWGPLLIILILMLLR